MSEYRYYEFLAIDRPLTERETAEMRGISSRAHITSTSFVNTYNWGDLKARPLDMMEKYFDAFVYVANWGTRRFMLRIPQRLVDAKILSLYRAGDSLSFETKGEHLIVEFMTGRESGGDWEEGEGHLSSLVPLRADLLNGDLRCLYLGWLLGAQMDDVEGDATEPPVPPGLEELTAPLKSLADFLRIDKNLIEAAAQSSPGRMEASIMEGDLRGWIQSLPGSEKDGFLVRLSVGEDLHIRAELLQKFRRIHCVDPTVPGKKRRTAGELLADSEERRTARRRDAAEREARERARREKMEILAREKHLDTLAGRQPEIWDQVEALIATKQPQKYDQAVTLLKDLWDLAARSGTREAFAGRLAVLRERHSRKPALLRRIDGLKGI